MNRRRDQGGARRLYIDPKLPTPTIMACGIGSVNTSQYFIDFCSEKVKLKNKPIYRVPSMAEIAVIPKNGYSVVSLFTGAGGSCLGFRMAGFKTLWASEFISEARAVYEANFSEVPVDGRDIRQVEPVEILRAAGIGEGELDVLEGSPPCASFSTAGKRERHWGSIRKYSSTKQRTDDLFFEFTRILIGLMPKVFSAENVSGLAKGVAKGYFKEIFAALEKCGYTVKARLLDAQWLGVPQARQRIFFVGVRQDLVKKYGIGPVFPEPLSYRYSVYEAIGVSKAVEDTGGDFSMGDITNRPSPTIRAGGVGHLYVEGGNGFDGHRYKSAERPMQTIQAGRPLNIIDQGERIDLRGCLAREYDKTNPGENSDKYFSLARTSNLRPCPTVSAVGGIGGGGGTAAVVHPSERRKFTIAELKRVCAFPDDFKLIGSCAQQWERLGRAVPPLMAFRVAEAIRDGIFAKIK